MNIIWWILFFVFLIAIVFYISNMYRWYSPEWFVGKKYILKDSPIEGKGVFAQKNIYTDDPIGKGIKYYGLPFITNDLGKWLNHSKNPNSKLDPNGNIVAVNNITPGEEITINYTQTPWYIQGPDPNW